MRFFKRNFTFFFFPPSKKELVRPSKMLRWNVLFSCIDKFSLDFYCLEYRFCKDRVSAFVNRNLIMRRANIPAQSVNAEHHTMLRAVSTAPTVLRSVLPRACTAATRIQCVRWYTPQASTTTPTEPTTPTPTSTLSTVPPLSPPVYAKNYGQPLADSFAGNLYEHNTTFPSFWSSYIFHRLTHSPHNSTSSSSLSCGVHFYVSPYSTRFCSLSSTENRLLFLLIFFSIFTKTW